MGYLLEKFWFCLLLAFVLGWILGWLMRQWRCRRELAALQAELDAANARLREMATPVPAPVIAPVTEPDEPEDEIDPDLLLSSYPIEEIEGIGQGYGRRLRALGIATTEDMLVKGRTHADRFGIAEQLDDPEIDVHVVTRWASMSDLCRLPGVRGQWAELFEFTSINSVQECAEQTAGSLTTRLAEVNEREHRVKELPLEEQVSTCIGDSQGLEQRIWFSDEDMQAEADAALDSYPIEEVEGVGPGFGRSLRNQGIATTMDLVQKGRQQSQRDEISRAMDESQVDGGVVCKWTSMCDLMRIPGIKGQFAELLTFGGVDTVSQLANFTAADLMALMEKTEAAQNRVPALPNIDKVAEWIEAAKTLTDMIDV